MAEASHPANEQELVSTVLKALGVAEAMPEEVWRTAMEFEEYAAVEEHGYAAIQPLIGLVSLLFRVWTDGTQHYRGPWRIS
jgi:hypothetical protein